MTEEGRDYGDEQPDEPITMDTTLYGLLDGEWVKIGKVADYVLEYRTTVKVDGAALAGPPPHTHRRRRQTASR